jgi:hypothetical protein
MGDNGLEPLAVRIAGMQYRVQAQRLGRSPTYDPDGLVPIKTPSTPVNSPRNPSHGKDTSRQLQLR